MRPPPPDPRSSPPVTLPSLRRLRSAADSDDVKLQPSGPSESEVERLLQRLKVCGVHCVVVVAAYHLTFFSDIAYSSPTECSHDGDNEEDFVLVEGKRHHIDGVTEELIARMSTDEMETYVRRYRHVWM